MRLRLLLTGTGNWNRVIYWPTFFLTFHLLEILFQKLVNLSHITLRINVLVHYPRILGSFLFVFKVFAIILRTSTSITLVLFSTYLYFLAIFSLIFVNSLGFSGLHLKLFNKILDIFEVFKWFPSILSGIKSLPFH